MIKRVAIGASLAWVLLLAGCRGSAGPVIPAGPGATTGYALGEHVQRAASWSSKIQHVIIVVQENRTFDNLFNGYPGADTQSWGLDHNGKRITLFNVSETAPYSVVHDHASFLTEFDNGKMDGFDVAPSKCNNPKKCPPQNRRAYGKVPKKQS